ncbi:MAG: helix-turn-helix domain-containing protein [Oscillospiraceae bacterium]|nr:helix-turn-helix domain-containing protein [Oscillospiraceae bacterium]
MEDTSATGNYYCIGHIVQFTGLSDRTIRSYISNGILQGEKINGLWHFAPEQVDAFMRHPSVRPSIAAKNNGIVYDFLLNRSQEEHRCCMILDLPGADKKNLTEFFCYAIGRENLHNFQFSFDGLDKEPRLIIRGDTKEVLHLVNGYYEHIGE